MEEFFIRQTNYKEVYQEDGPNPKEELSYYDDNDDEYNEEENIENEDIEYED